MSCGSAGNCAAGGDYTDDHGHDQGFVVSERNGRWGQAIDVPGLAALHAEKNAEVSSVSCGSAGSCAAGGFYTDGDARQQGFVASEKNGVWGRAIEVPGLGALNKGGYVQVFSVSCASAGSCAAGGFYGYNYGHGFVVSERNGRWGKAIEVPGLGVLNKGRNAEVSSVSCASAGSCAAGGFYTDGHGSQQGFVVSEKNGVWGRAIEVPGLGALNKVGLAEVNSVSCGSAGSCAAGGSYLGGHDIPGFVVSEKNGIWGKAIKVPGLGALNTGREAEVNSVSCASPGSCAAGGDYTDGHGIPYGQGFVVSETNGIWGKAIQVPGLAALNEGRGSGVSSVSCAPPGNCAAAGVYADSHRHGQGFVT